MKRPLPVLLVLPWTLAACGSTAARQLQDVAKDWSLVVRASQVIPVYPLTEDLQPGDLFLVQLTADRQQDLYDDQGFLPLDNHLDRIHPEGYEQFYAGAFGEDFVSGLPGSQQRPAEGRGWQDAPRSGFPSYSFSVRRGGGLDLALPVHGVPVGLALLGARAAEGTVSLQEARTLGVDTVSLYRQVRDWARANRELVQHFGASPPRNWLRVVSRVYLVGQVDVSLRAAEQRGAGLDAGASSPLPLLQPGPPPAGGEDRASQDYAKAIERINAAIAGSLTAIGGAGLGASLRVTAASSRSVSLVETFDPPLVFGYLGFDVPILQGGDLGAPIPTHAVLERALWRDFAPEAARAFDSGQRAVTRHVYLALKAMAAAQGEAAERVAELDALAELVPEATKAFRSLPGGVLVQEEWSPSAEVAPYLRFHAWRGRLRLSVQVLERLMEGGSVRLSGEEEPVAAGTPRWEELLRLREELAARLHDPAVEAKVADASRAAWRTFYRLAVGEEAR